MKAILCSFIGAIIMAIGASIAIPTIIDGHQKAEEVQRINNDYVEYINALLNEPS